MFFQFIVPSEDSATIVGKNGAANVVPIWGDNKLTFVEMADNGTVHTTAIYGIGLGKKAAAHSRAFGGEGYELPSQWYGFCEKQ